MTAPRVILASASPRRRELLALIGITHETRPAHLDETIRPGEAPASYAERVAREKAEAIAKLSEPSDVVIGADTIVIIDSRVLGKPADASQAAEMLRALSGRTHTVVTGIAVVREGKTVSSVEEVSVTFRKLSESEITAYIATGEPMDKAGAYGIQGYGATIVQRIEGDYFAVMGLSLARLIRLFNAAGITYSFGELTV